ncbi:MAG: DEAD/DEAH box helicase [Candidatus Geothermincolia bacterium]
MSPRKIDHFSAFSARYPFPLDSFQEEACRTLDQERSVLVVAPTGSGKTVVAEYAVFMAQQTGVRAFYTTPLKALSNQKFRDFSRDYGDGKVGLLTGDNSINSDAPLIIMTTEILRNMIYERSDTLTDLRYVILDEVHYLMDPYRGAVWEEILILLPPEVKLVGLSATVSNADDFGGWMNDLRGDMTVIASDRRPVPLRHYYFIGGTMVNLFSDGAESTVAEAEKLAAKRGPKVPEGRTSKALIPRRSQVAERLHGSGMLPAIYFIFSRAGCDAAVMHCRQDGLDLTTGEEKRSIEKQALERAAWLPPEDLRVFGFDHFLEALKMGLASHHAGLLPIFKEIVEDLFAQGLVKVVFATETLSLGINMPAKTCVIESLYKFSGESHEMLTSTQYTQFTGRAGRRGIDKVGNAVILYNPMVTLSEVQKLARTSSLPITSRFAISYNMAVNLLKSHSFQDSLNILNLSFAQYHADKDVVRLQRNMRKVEGRLDKLAEAMSCEKAEALEYLEIRNKLAALEKEASMRRSRRRAEAINHELEELAPGDVLVIERSGKRRSGVVLSIGEEKNGEPKLKLLDRNGRYLTASHRHFRVPPQAIGHIEERHLAPMSKKNRRFLMDALAKFEMPPRQPYWEAEDEHRDHTLREEISEFKEDLQYHPCSECERREECVEAARTSGNLAKEVEQLRAQMESRSDVASRKLLNVRALLQHLGYLDGDIVSEKGVLLGEIYNECDLVLVEAISSGLFHELGASEVAAFASIFVYESRDSGVPRWRGGKLIRPATLRQVATPRLRAAISRTRALEGRLKSIEQSERLDLLRRTDIGFVNVVYDWAEGVALEEIMDAYPQFSAGDFVRSMKQVLDILRQMQSVVRDDYLRAALGAALDAVHRSVVAYTSVVDVAAETGSIAMPAEGA